MAQARRRPASAGLAVLVNLILETMPHLSQETIRLLDDTDLGALINVHYLLGDGVKAVASGFYGGLPHDGDGEACIAVEGIHLSRVLIRMLDVVSVSSTKQPAGKE